MAHLLNLLDNIKDKINNINVKIDQKKINKLSQTKDKQSKAMDVILDHGSKTKDKNNIPNITKDSINDDKPKETTKITLQPANISEEKKSEDKIQKSSLKSDENDSVGKSEKKPSEKKSSEKDSDKKDSVKKVSAKKVQKSNTEITKPEVKLPEPVVELADDDGFSGGSLKIQNKENIKLIKRALQKINKNKKGVYFKRKIPIYNSRYQYGGGSTSLNLDKILLKNNNLYAELNNGKLFKITKFE